MDFIFQGANKAEGLMKESSAFNRLNLLKGYEGVWIQARRDNKFYILNKILSIAIAVFCAYVTLSFKRTTQIFNKQIEDQESQGMEATNVAYHMTTIYWFLFIYYSLAAFDEMIELFSVINQLEKGALGLFFEMNYFIGTYLTFYIAWFVNKYEPPEATEANKKYAADYDKMYNWVFWQYIYMFLGFVFVIAIWFVYSKMDREAKGIRNKGSKRVNDDHFTIQDED